MGWVKRWEIDGEGGILPHVQPPYKRRSPCHVHFLEEGFLFWAFLDSELINSGSWSYYSGKEESEIGH